MSRTERNLLAAMAVVITLMAARIVRAQDNGASSPDVVPANDDATVLVLAQAFVAEGNWDAASDHAAIAHVLLKRATQRGITLQQQAIEYCSAFRVDTARTRWVLGLRLDAQKPEEWPARYSWAAHVDRWLKVIDLARRFVADPASVPNPCPSARHFGGSMDAQKAGTVPARCSARTKNTFYAVASR